VTAVARPLMNGEEVADLEGCVLTTSHWQCVKHVADPLKHALAGAKTCVKMTQGRSGEWFLGHCGRFRTQRCSICTTDACPACQHSQQHTGSHDPAESVAIRVCLISSKVKLHQIHGNVLVSSNRSRLNARSPTSQSDGNSEALWLCAFMKKQLKNVPRHTKQSLARC
jgi:hypothetical protein